MGLNLLPPDTHGDASVMAIIVSLKRRLDTRSDGDRELQFFSHVLRYLTTSTGQQVELQRWMITSYEVEFGRMIGAGGLCAPTHPVRLYVPMTDSKFATAGRYLWALGTILP